MKETEKAQQSALAIRKFLLMSKEKEYKAEILRLQELFEEQYPKSPGYLYDDLPYMGFYAGTAEISDQGYQLIVRKKVTLLQMETH